MPHRADRPANIDDSAGYPWLYDSPQEQEHLFAIWRRLATHYRDEPAVLGYDLLNEPIPHFPKLAPLNSSLEPLYKKLSGDRKSTRLNSSHSQISYAVFCLKKKKKK